VRRRILLTAIGVLLESLFQIAALARSVLGGTRSKTPACRLHADEDRRLASFFAENLWLTLLAGLAVVALVSLVWLLSRSTGRYQRVLSLRYVVTRFSASSAFLAIAFGVAVILVALSIMSGYIDKLRDNLRGQESDLVVFSARRYQLTDAIRLQERLATIDNVKNSALYIETLAMYRSGGFNPCQLRGVEIDRHCDVTGLGEYTLRPEELIAVLDRTPPPDVDGELTATEDRASRESQTEAITFVDEMLKNPARPPLSGEEFQKFFSVAYRREILASENPTLVQEFASRIPPVGVLVGIQLLLEREMFLGQIITAVTVAPDTSEPINIPLIVVGAFKTGAFDADSKILYTDVRPLRNKLSLYDHEARQSRYEGLRVAVKDDSKLSETFEKVRALITQEFPSLIAIPWDRMQRTVITAVEIEKYLIYFLLLLLVAFTACMILLMLILTVIEKTRDIGVLLALGATPKGVVGIFLINGLALTLGGTVTGLLGGYYFCEYINPIHDWVYHVTNVRLFSPDVYDMDRIPIAYRLWDLFLSIAPALALGFCASLMPAIWASRRDPIKALHYE